MKENIIAKNFGENFLKYFDEEIADKLSSHEVLKELIDLDKNFRLTLKKDARQRYTELEDCLKVCLKLREEQLLAKAFEFLHQTLYFD